jgi:DNA-binding IclR family transcriptional regulator
MLDRNFTGIAVPAFDNSNISGTLTILGPSEYMSRARQRDLVKLLLDAARTLSRQLG